MRPTPRRLPATALVYLAGSKILGIRAGREDHRWLGVWVVTVQGRAFIRPWNDKPAGWRAVFRRDPLGTIQLGDVELPIRARAVRGARLNDAIDAEYARKYPTPASRKWVRGFATEKRRATTVELLPR